MLKEVRLPKGIIHVGAYLTFRCAYNCSYCINHQGTLKVRRELLLSQWIDGLNRLQIERDWMIPIALQGGEPSVYPGYLTVIKNLKDELYIDMLTNLDFDVIEFMDEIPPERMQRDVPYASIRATYHPGKIEINEFVGKIFNLQNKKYSVEAYGINHPDLFYFEILEKCRNLGVSFIKKEFFGVHNKKLYGTYKYHPDTMQGGTKKVECRTIQLLIGPNGDIHRCHRDLFCGENSLGNILDKDLKIEFKYRKCRNFGECSYVDVRMKTDRFGKKAICRVEIRRN